MRNRHTKSETKTEKKEKKKTMPTTTTVVVRCGEDDSHVATVERDVQGWLHASS